MADKFEDEALSPANEDSPQSSIPPSPTLEKPPEEGRRGGSKLRDIMRRQRRDSDVKTFIFKYLLFGSS